MPLRTLLLLLLRAAFLGRHRLVLENLALRQQLAVLKGTLAHLLDAEPACYEGNNLTLSGRT